MLWGCVIGTAGYLLSFELLTAESSVLQVLQVQWSLESTAVATLPLVAVVVGLFAVVVSQLAAVGLSAVASLLTV